MSIRHFHIFFIVVSLALCAFMTYWSGHHLAHGHGNVDNFLLAISGALGLAAGVPYLLWFIRKSKTS